MWRWGFLLWLCRGACLAGGPENWIPARWTGGPVELEHRAKAGVLPSDPAVRDMLGSWYDRATLDLLAGSPVNCLLVTWSAGASDAVERKQQELVKDYAAEAHRRGITVLAVLYPGAEPSAVGSARAAGLDGILLEGEFPSGFARNAGSMVVIPMAGNRAMAGAANAPIIAVEGVPPSARSLSAMGIRAGPSSQPWIQSNIWQVRSFRFSAAWRPIWISYQPEDGTSADYARSVADAAVAGGRWIVALDDALRVRMRRGEADALGAWNRIGTCLRFAEAHAEWRSFVPYGNFGIIVDTAATDRDFSDEYLKLVARRQVPYRLIARSGLSRETVGGFRALLATELAAPTEAERRILLEFAGNGGRLIAGPTWGDVPPGEAFIERPLGKGRVTVYRDPEPESMAREVREMLSVEEAGLIAFNLPSVILYASRDGSGRRVLVQLLNYSGSPATGITIRVAGRFRGARFITPDAEPVALATTSTRGSTDITIPKLAFWGGVLLEGPL